MKNPFFADIPKYLAFLLVFCAVLTLYSVGLLLSNTDAFLSWIREDWLVEYLTSLALFAGTAFSIVRARRYAKAGNSAAARIWYIAAFVFLFGALEEISYGQRIFGIQTPDFMLQDGSQGKDEFYNRQNEITLHNLVIYGVNINKLVFGKILGIIIGVYCLIVPLFHRFNSKAKLLFDQYGIPIIQNYQIVYYLLLGVPMQFLRSFSPKSGEVGEFVGAFVFLAVVLHPKNLPALMDKKSSTKPAD